MTATNQTQPRVLRGIPTAGRWSATSHTEATERLVAPHASELEEALDLSTLSSGEFRTIGPGVHGIAHVDTITLRNLGPNEHLRREQNAIAMDFTLPKEANIAELYELSEYPDAQREAYYAAKCAVEDEVLPPQEPTKRLPPDTVDLDEDGNLRFTSFDAFDKDGSIDPEDLKAWTSEYEVFTDPRNRADLADNIRERYTNP